MTGTGARDHADESWPMPWKFLGFFLLWNAAMWAILGAALAPAVPGGWSTVVAVAAFTLLPIGVLLRSFTGAPPPGPLTRVLVMRPFWYVQLALPFLAAVTLVGAAGGLVVGAPGTGARVVLAGAGGVVAVGALAGYVGSKRLVVHELTIAFPDLPAGLDGLRVAQVSDVHVGPHTPDAHLSRITRAIADVRPELVAFTGDQVDDHAPDVRHFARAFADVRAPLGVFAIAGNHDVYAGWRDVRRGMEDAGMTVLVNDARAVKRDGAELWVIGTGDPAAASVPPGWGEDAAPDVPRALAGVPDGAFTLALAHNPALWPALAERGVHLTLAGHTHHGQISVPLLGWCLASPFLEFAMGQHVRGRSVLHVNPGTNYWGVPLRLGAWPEVTVVTLARDHGPAVARSAIRPAP